MGASGWAYYVPYQSDIKKAFQTLRNDVFNSNEYYTHGYLSQEPIKFEDFMPPDPDLTDEDIECFKNEYKQYIEQYNTKPENPDQLLQKCGESGTHTIIDITSITLDYHEGESGPIKKEDLIDLFGTDKPALEIVKAKEMKLQTYRGRWFCTYVVIYENEKPSQILFTGFSGD